MNASSASWVAILILNSELDSQNNQKESEPYILSKKEATYIGRSQDCQFILSPKYSTVSRYHAKVELVNQDSELVWQIHDLGTPNGTFVNDKRVKDFQCLKSGDLLTLGKPNGANFTFEWKFIEIEKLNEVFRKKRLYDETVVPSMNDFENNEEKTYFFNENLAQNPLRENPQKNDSIGIEKSTPNSSDINKNIIDINSRTDKKRHVKNSSRIFSVLLSIFIILFLTSFLIYLAQGIFEAQTNKNEELKSYIESISRLLLDKKLDSLSPDDPDARKAREAANGQTLVKLKDLDGQAKGSLLRFLHKAKLIKIQPEKLSKEWLLNINANSNKRWVQLLSLDYPRKELVYLRQDKAGVFNSYSLPILLINQVELNQKYGNKKCIYSPQSNRRDLICALALPFKAKSQLYEKPFITPIQLSGSDLTGVVLKDAPLEDINLEGSYISFRECKQNSSENFFEDTFYRKPVNWFSRYKCTADFSGSGLQGARLFQSILMGANLSNAKLDYADLRQADLRGANLANASLKGAVLTGACYIEENWEKNFPKKGPTGNLFNPLSEGMRPISIYQSNTLDPTHFQECKNFATSKSDSSP
jgi:pSer/pThr/pTyr-binding forkhead associated (FHA) protein